MQKALLDQHRCRGRYSTNTKAEGATQPTQKRRALLDRHGCGGRYSTDRALVDQREPGLEVETAAEVGAAAEIAAEVSPAAVVTAVGAGIGAGVIGRGVG
jgi:hypothetical protein